ncbi:MAG TPA: hypothetical protein VGA56_07970 [Opitutaceae bacterium]
MHWALLVLAVSLSAANAAVMDEVVLKNGRHYLGQIISESPESIVIAIDGGTVEFPRSTVASPPYRGPAGSDTSQVEPPMHAEVLKEAHPIPSVAVALRRLHQFDWASEVGQVPALVTDRGRWQFLPCVSFWAGGFARINFYGDPERPAAIEVSLLDPPAEAWDRKRELLEFVLSVVPALALDDRFDRLDVHGDSFASEDLWFAITEPNSRESPGRWAVLLLHERSLTESRATVEEIQAVSESLQEATLDPNRPRSWQRGSWTIEDVEWLRRSISVRQTAETGDNITSPAWTALGGERVFVRSFTRDGGKYARSTNDWLREVAANKTP